MNLNNLRPDGTWKWSLVVKPTGFGWSCLSCLCRLRTVRCRPPCGQDSVVLATYSGKPKTSAIPLCEKLTTHWEWEMTRVACTHLTETSQMT